MKVKRPVIGITLDGEGEYLKLKQHYCLAVSNAGGVPVLLPGMDDPPEIARLLDGLLIPGGFDIDPAYFSEAPHPAVRLTPRDRTDFEIALLRAIMVLRKPVFGICYGMQLINVALGGSLYQDLGAQYGAAIDHGNGSHWVTGDWSMLKGETLVNTSHHQGVKKLGGELEIRATSDDGLVEAIVLPRYPFLVGVQWHPERLDNEVSRYLFSSFVEAARARK
jgi:putative glutamine amidotransferase